MERNRDMEERPELVEVSREDAEREERERQERDRLTAYLIVHRPDFTLPHPTRKEGSC